jgi:hypothetical protein
MQGGGLSGTLSGRTLDALQMDHITSARRFISAGLDLGLTHIPIIWGEDGGLTVARNVAGTQIGQIGLIGIFLAGFDWNIV